MEEEDYRSKSYRVTSMQPEENTYAASNPSGMQDLRCYSASYASSSAPPHHMEIVVAASAEGGGGGEQWKFKKGKSTNAVGGSKRNWSLTDPELLRKKRVASYKVYSVEGKIKGSFRKSFRWIKDKCSRVVYGYR